MAKHDLRNDPVAKPEPLAGRSLRAAHAWTTAPPPGGARLRGAVLRRAGGERVFQGKSAPAPRMGRRSRIDSGEPRPSSDRVADEPLRRGHQELKTVS